MTLSSFRIVVVLLLWGLFPSSPAHAARKDVFLPQLVASSFIRAVLNGRVEVAAPLCAPRVNFDGYWVEGEKPLRQALVKLAGRARRGRVRLRSVRILSRAEMIGRYGAPPPRLKKVLGRSDVLALVRFDRLGLVIGLERQGRLYRVKLLTD